MNIDVVGILAKLGVVSAIMAFMYFMWWLIKTFSYWLFYEDMVIQTTMEVLKSTGLVL